MGLEVLAGAAIGLQGINMVAQMGAAGSSAKMAGQVAALNQQRAKRTYDANVKAAQTNLANEYEAISVQQEGAAEAGVQMSTDRIRAAKRELGTIRVLAGEMGTGGTTFGALVNESAYAEGADLSRISTTVAKQIAAGEMGKKAAKQTFDNTITGAGLQFQGDMEGAAVNLAGAKAQSQAATTSAILGFLGSGLQIGANYSSTSRTVEAMERRDRR